MHTTAILNHSIVTLNEVKSLRANSVNDLRKIGFKRDSSPVEAGSE